MAGTGGAALIATLGTEAQVITAAWDLLTRRGETLTRLKVIHTNSPDPAVQGALDRLQALRSPEFPIETHPLSGPRHRLFVDVETPDAADAFFRLAYRLVWEAKKTGLRVHLSIAGGRKTMAVFAMTVAQMLFDDDDCLWHLFSAGEFLTSKRLHPQEGDEVFLLPIPVLRWSQISPVFSSLKEISDPFLALDRIRALQLSEKAEQSRAYVLGSLTPAEARVVELLVREGLSDHEIAGRLNLSARTVEQHLRSAYVKAADHWNLDQVGRGQLIALLNFYFNIQITGKPA